MKRGIFLLLALLLTVSWAFAEKPVQPAKSAPIQYDPANYPTPTRQGGDDVASAMVIGALPFNDSGTTAGYVNDYDEACPYTGSTAPDVVYSYTPAADELVTFSLCGDTDYDSKLYIYENAVTPGAPFGCNDDFCVSALGTGFVSELSGQALIGGNTYYIIVDGYGGGSGNYEIDVTSATGPPANDTCATAETIGEVTDYAFDTSYATASGLGYVTSNDLWYVFTASGDGMLYVGVCDSGFDTKIALYGACDAATLIASNDDSCGVQSELIDVPVVAGTDYYIQVGGYGTAYGSGLLDIDLVLPTPTNDTCATAEVVGEVTDLPFDTSAATASGFGYISTSPDIWYVFTATSDGLLYVGLCGSSFDTKLALYDDCVPTNTLGTNDDSCSLQSELIDIPVVAGEDYFIQVGGYSSSYYGAGLLDVDFTPAGGTFTPYAETFDAGVPAGWTIDPIVASDSWEAFLVGPGHPSSTLLPGDHTGNGGYFMGVDDSTPETVPAHLYSPAIDLNGAATPYLTFYYWIGDATNASTINIDINDGTTTTADVAIFGETIDHWAMAAVDLSPWLNQTITIDFRAMESTSFYGDICMDDVEVVDASVPPLATTLVTPADLATDVTVLTNLEWNSAAFAGGYYLSFGTDNPPTNLMNGVDLGNVNVYEIPGLLSTFTMYYWQIIPFNAYGAAAGCPVWSFETGDFVFETLPLVEDFETGAPSWTSGTLSAFDTWEIAEPLGLGTSNNVPYFADPLADHSDPGTYCAGTDLTVDGDYENLENSFLLSPVIDCTAAPAVNLTFWRYLNCEINYDEAYVEVSNDGGVSWMDLGQPLYIQDSLWTEVSIDITAYAAGYYAQVRWRIDSDSSVPRSGWNLDDVSITIPAPTAPNVIFSEYIEGSSNNKALEIWNNTGDVINLDEFRIAQSVNGGGWAFWHIFPTGATVVDQDVWVMLNADTDPLLFDPANADEILTYPSVVHHNGDDARGLEWTPDGGTTWLLIDVIGIPTEDPGTGWDVAGVTEATANHTLYRKDAIMSGNTDWLLEAGTNADDSEWIVYEQNTFMYLGQHPYSGVFAAPENVMVDATTALVTWNAPAVIIAEDCFDTYTPGDFLGVVNPTMWTTWSNLPGGSEDVLVSDTQAASPDNSILVQANNDCVMIMNDYTAGIYSFAMDVFVPTGFGGYFNLQKTSVPGTEWAFELMLNDDGSAVANAGANAALSFNYAHDTWMNMKLVVDLNNDWCDFYVDGSLMIGYQWSLGTAGTAGLLQFGGVNIYGGGCTGTPMFYLDNVVLTELVPATDTLIGYNVYLDGAMVGTTTDLEYQLDTATMINGTTYTAGVSAVYDDPGESVIVDYTFNYINTPLDYIQIGNGTTYGTAPVYYADFCNYWENAHTQTLYLASELGAANVFTQLQWEIEQIATPDNWLDNVVISIMTTTDTALTPGAFYDTTGATVVWGPVSGYVPATATGWNTPIDIIDYAYNGTDNLIVDILWGDNGYYESPYYRHMRTDGGVTRVLLGYADSETPPNYDAASNEFANIRFWTTATFNPMIAVNPTAINQTVQPDEVVVVPLTITNDGTADLTYDITVSLDPVETNTNRVRRNSNNLDNVYSETDPDWKKTDMPNATEDLWDLQFQYPCAVATGEAGFETDGQYMYTTEWNGAGGFFRYEMDGTYVGTFVIAGVAGVRDLAYDGTYFYGAAANTTLFQLDFTMGAEALVSTITAPVACRAIAYDDGANGFWANNWSTDITLFDYSGTVLNSFPVGTALSYYGLAYDAYSDGGPYLWGFSQAPVLTLVQFDIATGLETGVTFDVGTLVGSVGSSGGMFIAEGIVPGTVTLGCLVQNEWLVGLELGAGDEPWLNAAPITGTVPAGGSVTIDVTLDATDLIDIVKEGALIIANNAGDPVVVPVTMNVEGNGGEFDPPQNVMVDDETGLVTWTPPAAIIAEDNFDSYTPGDYLAVVNPTLWTTWSNAPGGSEDVVITDAQSNSPDNSFLVELNNDNVMIMNDYTSGVYSMDIDMYVPTGYCGYYNMQKTSVPGTEWAWQIYFQTDGTAIADAGAAAALTFNYFHDEWMDLRLVIDLDNDWCDFYFNNTHMIGYQWTLGTFGTAGLLQLGGMNIFGGANSTTTDTPMFYIDNMEFKDLTATSDALTGYNVYLDGAFVAYTTDEFYQLTGLVNGTTYMAGVSAVYDEPGESAIVDYEFTYGIPAVLPPNNLEAAVEDYNNVLLTWELPGGASDEIFYHSGYDNNGIGTNGVVDFICCARFTAEELADYYGGWSITGVNIFLHSMDFSYAGIKVYEGGSLGNPGTVVYDQDITSSAVALDWTNHLLTTPVPLVAGNEYWIGYDLSATADHPAAVDMGPMVPDKGAWMFYSGAWDTLAGMGLDYNWVITGIVSQMDQVASGKIKQSNIIGSSKVQSRSLAIGSDAQFEAEYTHKVRQQSTQQTTSRSLAGYKVYRDGAEITEISDPAELEYLDEGLDAGTYEYYVTATYTNPDDESGPSNLVNAVITLPAPTGLTATSNWPNILCTWTAMPGVQGYNLYQDDVLVTNTTSTFYLHANVPAGEYIYNIAAVFNGGYEGDWSVDVTVNHEDPNGADPNLIPLVTSLDGNYPNPFNPTTMIKFGLHEDAKVAINVYNIKGEKVRTLVNGELEAGYHNIVWNGKDDSGKTAASGVYFYKMKAGKYVETNKMILMK